MNILHIGIKYWPYSDNLTTDSELIGIRGGGMNKYCDLLINSFPISISSFVICQKLIGQKINEKSGNVSIYRLTTFGGRATRQILTNVLSLFVGMRIIKKENIDVIHGHMQPGIFIAYCLGKIYKKPVVGTPYSFATVEMNYFLNKIAKHIEKKYYPKVDVLVFESEENREKAFNLRKLAFPNSVVIHTGIEIPKISYTHKINNKFNLFFIGRLVKIKAIDNLLLAIKYLNQKDIDRIHLDIIGEGEMKEKLKRIIDINNLGNVVTLHGYLEDVSPFFINGEIFILPSYQEGLSIALLEAMSFGKACIVNNFGVPFNNGSVFEMENNEPSTIANAISVIINNKTLYKSLCVNSRKEIYDNFSVKKFSETYCDMYNKLRAI